MVAIAYAVSDFSDFQTNTQKLFSISLTPALSKSQRVQPKRRSGEVYGVIVREILQHLVEQGVQSCQGNVSLKTSGAEHAGGVQLRRYIRETEDVTRSLAQSYPCHAGAED